MKTPLTFCLLATCLGAFALMRGGDTAIPPRATEAADTTTKVGVEQSETWIAAMHQGTSVEFVRERVDATLATDGAFHIETLGPLSARSRQEVQGRMHQLQATVKRELDAFTDSPTTLSPHERATEADLVVELARYQAMSQELIDGGYWTVGQGEGYQQLGLDLEDYFVAVTPAIEGNEVREVVFAAKLEDHPRLREAVTYCNEMHAVARYCAVAEFNALSYEDRKAFFDERARAQRENDQQTLQAMMKRLPMGVGISGMLLVMDDE